MTMTKRIISILLLVILVFTVGTGALADKKAREPSEVQMAVLRVLVDDANEEVAQLVAKTQADAVGLSGKKLDKLIKDMLKEVDKINKEPLKYARQVGATVICEVEYFNIGGLTVGVDPLKVINREQDHD